MNRQEHAPGQLRGSLFRIVAIAALVCLLAVPALSGASALNTSVPSPVSQVSPAGGTGNTTSGVEILLFYDPTCGECQKVLAYLPKFLASHPDVNVSYHDISANPATHELFHQMSEAYNKPSAYVPAIFAGGRELNGYQEITENLDSAVRAAAAGQTAPFTPEQTVPATTTSPFPTSLPVSTGPTGGTNASTEILVFYNPNCHECQQVLTLLPGVLASHPEVTARYFDIFGNREYQDLFQQYNERYNRPFSPVPAVFVGDRELVGFDEVSSNLTGAILAAERNKTPLLTPTPTPTANVTGPGTEVKPPALTIPLIITAGLIDGINPCAFAVLTFLLVTITAQESRRRVLAVGIVYTSAVFIFYFLSGLGLFSLVQVSGMSKLFSLGAAAVALAAGLLMIRDAFNVGSPILAIPESRKGVIERYITRATLPAAFILGILVGMFELPCTGGIYLAILSLLSQSMTLAAGIPLLLLYNVFFIIPLIIVLFVVYFGIPPEKFKALQSKHRMAVRLCMAALMIGIAAWLLYTILV